MPGPAWWASAAGAVARAPATIAEIASRMKSSVASANATRPSWPSSTPPATSATSARPIGVLTDSRLGTYAISADAPAAQLTATVRVKSTSSAPSGMNAQPSPKAAATPSGPPPPLGKRPISW